jgi:MFS family permease
MPLVVLGLTGSGAMLGLVAALELLPALLLALPTGALADRLDRRLLLAWSDAGRALLTAAIPLALWLDWSATAVILVVTVPISGLRALFQSAFTSAVPGLVGRENLGRAMGYLESTLSVPYIVGPALAGVLLVTAGPAWTLAIDAASFGLSALSLRFVHLQVPARPDAAHSSLTAEMRAGLRYVRTHRQLLLMIGYWSVIGLATAGILPALSYYLTVDRAHGAELFGFVGSVWSVGYLAASLVGARWGNRALELRLIGAGAAIGAALVITASVAHPAPLLLAGAVIGAAVAVQFIAYATLRALVTPDELLGRVGATARMFTLALQPLGVLGTGLVIEWADGGAALVAMGAILLLASLLFGPAMIRSPSPEPA